MEELVVLLAQFLFEVTLNVLANVPLDWPSKNRSTPDPERVWPSAFLRFLVGAFLGWLSALVFRHTLITLPALRMLNVVAAPVASAYLSQTIAAHRCRANANITPRNHFWYAYWFTLGLALVRLAYAERA